MLRRPLQPLLDTARRRGCAGRPCSAAASAPSPLEPPRTLLPPLPPGLVRPVLEYPEPTLRLVAAAVADPGSAAVRRLCADLVATARAHEAMGCAAPQVGEGLRVFVVRRPLARNEGEARALRARLLRMSRGRRAAAAAPPPLEYVVAVNPAVVASSPETEVGVESCLSVPDYPALVRRHAAVDVAYVDGATGEAVRERLSGLPAVVFQHELDHLDGVLLMDRELRAVGARGGGEGDDARDAELDAAYERWMLGVMRFYGAQPSDPLPA